MKRFFVYSLAVAALLLASACNKDDNNQNNASDNNSSGGKKLSKVTWIYDEGGAQTFSEETIFTWDGANLKRVELWDEGERDYYADFTYSNGRLDEITFQETGKGGETDVFRLTYNGDRITGVACYYDGVHEDDYVLSYNNEGLLSSFDINSGYFVFYLTWTNGNITRRDVVSEGYNLYLYDNKRNPYPQPFALLMAFLDEELYYLSANNLETKRWIPENGGNSSTRSYTYTYDGDYPSMCSYSSAGGSGRYYFQYTDGGGLTPPAH